MLKHVLLASAGLVVVSCLAPDVEIVSTLGGAGFAGIGNVGGVLGSGGTSNPITCPSELPPIGPFPCTQEGLACDYGNTHCVCRQFQLQCTASGSGGSGGASSGGSGGTSSGGSGTSGSAGSGGSGGSAGSGGSGGQQTACVDMVSAIFFEDAYLQNGNWHGYAYPIAEGTGSTIMPTSFAGWAPSSAPCACGTIGTGGQASAGIGFNVDQPEDGSTIGSLFVTGPGLEYNVTSTLTNMRVMLLGPNAGGDPNQIWCFDLFGVAQGTIAWSDFNNDCGTGTDVPFDQAQNPISRVVFTYIAGTSPQDFELCVGYVGEAL